MSILNPVLIGEDTSDATAMAEDILAGKTAYVDDDKIVGTMANNGAVTRSLNAGSSYTIPSGYHNGSGKITASSLANQTSATATVDDIAEGKTAWVNGEKITGVLTTQSATSEPLDPVEVYKNTRPADWLPMPEPMDNEMYLLFHIPDGVSSLLAFTVECTGNYTIELGNVIDGKFTKNFYYKNGMQGMQPIAKVASGSVYENEVVFPSTLTNCTSTGMNQVMVKISGTDILSWRPSTHSKKPSPAKFARWNIVEIACRLPKGTKVACGNWPETLALQKMRYFSWYGTNAVTSMYEMFHNCCSLTSIPQLDTSKVTNMNGMFNNCYSLASIPQLDTSRVTDMSRMFYNCNSLTSIPQLNTSAVTDMSRMFYLCYSLPSIPQLDTSAVKDMSEMFRECHSLITIPRLNTLAVTEMNFMFNNCYSLASIPQLDTSKVTDMSSMFFYCYSLTTIPQLDTSAVTNMSNMLSNCSSLTSILFNPSVTNWAGYAIRLDGCSLGHTAIVALFNSLPTITASKAITLTGNPGVSELTDEEKAIATGKNWTLTL